MFEYVGTEEIGLLDDNLLIKTSVNEVIEQKPVAFQLINNERKPVKCDFILEGNKVSFRVDDYNKKYPLIIDPVLIFSTYTCSRADNFGMTATYDHEGNLYAGGIAFTWGYPTTPGAYCDTANPVDNSPYGITDVVISKFNSTGTDLIYSTYLGGGTDSIGTETVHSLIVNDNNELFLYGVTDSPDFPITSNAYDQTFEGGDQLLIMNNGTYFYNGTDIYVAKFNAAGTDLLGSTYIGGSSNDGVNYNTPISTYDSLQFNYGDQFRGEVMIDADGNCYVASTTWSDDFPVINGFQSSFGGEQDGVVFKLNSDLSDLIWSTYIGGSQKDAAYSIKLDSSNNAYIAGGTCSSDFPTTSGVINSSYQGGSTDGFIAKIKNDGSVLLQSTFLGTSEYDQCYFVELDRHEYVYTVGQTLGNYPVQNVNYWNPNSPQFIQKMSNNLNEVIYSTVFGNGSLNEVNISPSAFLVDHCENVYVSGWGGHLTHGIPTYNMPSTPDLIPDALLPQPTDGYNWHLIVFSRNIDTLLFACMLGGDESREHVDGGTSRFDKNGIVYQSVCANCCSGCDSLTVHSDFPTTPGAFCIQNANTDNYNCNNALFKFDFQILPNADFTVDYLEGCAPLTVTFSDNSINSSNFLWDFGNGDTTSTNPNPVVTYDEAGTYTVILLIEDSICMLTDTAVKIITVYPALITFSDTTYNDCGDTCTGTATVFPSGGSSPYYYLWSDEQQQTTQTAEFLCVGTYYVTVTDEIGCTDVDTVEIADPSDLDAIASATPALCYDSCDATAVVTASLGAEPYSYIWTDVDGIEVGTTDSVDNLCVGYYYVTVTDDAGCVRTLTVQVTQPDSIYAEIFVTSDTICYGDSVDAHVQAYGGTPDYSYFWGPPLNSTEQTVTGLTEGEYWVTVIDENECPYSVGIIITDPPPLDLDSLILGAVCETCYGQITLIPVGGAGSYTYDWSTGNIDSIISGLDGGFYYDVTVTDAWNCTIEGTFYVGDTIWDPPLDAWADPDTIFIGQSSQLEATHGYEIYDWTEIVPPGTGSLDDPIIYNPLATPGYTTTYLVHILDSCGCESWDTVRVVVEDYICADPFIYIPNAFSPNGDGINDILYVRSEVADQLYLAIYDRWGQLVFVTEDFNTGWDGTFKGKPVDPAVFAYYLKARCLNMEIYEKKGNITVVR